MKRYRLLLTTTAVGILFLLFTVVSPNRMDAQSNIAMMIYDDGLQNGWQDWAWGSGTTTDLASTTQVNSGSVAFEGMYGAAWSGMRFHAGSALNTADFTDVQFWLYTDSAEEIDVGLQDSAQDPLGSKVRVTPTPGQWQLVTVPMSDMASGTFQNVIIQGRANAAGQTIHLDDVALLGLPMTAVPTIAVTLAPTPVPGAAGNPFYETYIEKSAPAVQITNNSLPTTGGTAVTINVNPSNLQQVVYPTQFGNNAGVWMGDNDLLSPETFDRLTTIDIPFIRFPGGSTSDIYVWNVGYNDENGQVIQNPPYLSTSAFNGGWAVDTYEFLTWAEQLGAIPLITVNHGLAVEENDLAAAEQLAADWVEYANAPNDGSNPNGGVDWAAVRAADGHPAPFDVSYWTVGNEVYGSWEAGHLPNGADYAVNFNGIYDAMKAVDPDIYIGIVGDSAGHADWFVEVLSDQGAVDRMDFIDVHNYYFYTGGGEIVNEITEADILDLSDQIGEDRATMDQMIAAHTNRQPGEIPYYYGEFNATNGVNYHHVQLVNGLWYGKAIGEMIVNEFVGAAKWDIFNGWNADTGGDMGMLARNNDANGVPDFTPYPSYYPYYFYGVNFGDRIVETSSTRDDVVVYGSQFTADGNLALIIINETAAKNVSLDLGSFVAGDVNGWSLSGAGLDAFPVTLNGVANGYTYGGPLIEDVTPYYTDLAGSTAVTVALEPYSVTSLIIYADTAVTPTPTSTDTPIPPTAVPTNTPIPPTTVPTDTPTSLPPTAVPTDTPIPPTAIPTDTPTSLPPTLVPTDTPVSPTATPSIPLAVESNGHVIVGTNSFVYGAIVVLCSLMLSVVLTIRRRA